MKKIFLVGLAVFFSVLLFGNVGEIRKGSVKGFVFDADTKVPLEYATIAIKNKATNKLDGTISDQTGFFRITDLDFGKYSIEVTFIGYETKALPEFEITDKG